MSRFPETPEDLMYFEQRRVRSAIAGRRKPSVSSNGGVEGPFVPLLYIPGILDRFQDLGEHCRFNTSLAAHLREMAIMMAARNVSQPIEFRVHAMEAREFGLADEIIDALAADVRPALMGVDEAIVFDFCREMFTTGTVSAPVVDRAEERFGKEWIIDLIVTCGYYSALGTVLNVTKWTPVRQFEMPFEAPVE